MVKGILVSIVKNKTMSVQFNNSTNKEVGCFVVDRLRGVGSFGFGDLAALKELATNNAGVSGKKKISAIYVWPATSQLSPPSMHSPLGWLVNAHSIVSQVEAHHKESVLVLR